MTTFWYLSGIQYAMQIKILSKRYFRAFIITFVVVGLARLIVSPIYADLIDPSTEKLRAEYDSATCPGEMKECRWYVQDYVECEALSKNPMYYLLSQSPGATIHYEKYCKKNDGSIATSLIPVSPTPNQDIVIKKEDVARQKENWASYDYKIIVALSIPLVAFIILLIRKIRSTDMNR